MAASLYGTPVTGGVVHSASEINDTVVNTFTFTTDGYKCTCKWPEVKKSLCPHGLTVVLKAKKDYRTFAGDHDQKKSVVDAYKDAPASKPWVQNYVLTKGLIFAAFRLRQRGAPPRNDRIKAISELKPAADRSAIRKAKQRKLNTSSSVTSVSI